jgi:hypothetical protein
MGSGQARDRVADDEAPLDDAGHANAAVRREVGVGAGHPDAMAERGAGDEQP